MTTTHTREIARAIKAADDLYAQRIKAIRKTMLGNVRHLKAKTQVDKDEPPYTCPELQQHAMRPGAEDFLNLPSRIGDVLHYRDGTSQPTTHASRISP